MTDAVVDPEETRPPAEPPGVVEPDEESEVDAGEAEEPPPPPPRIDPLISALRAEVAARDEQLRSYITAYKQATADMQRERERMARERDTVAETERQAIAGDLLEVLDDLDRSLQGCGPGASLESVTSGLQLVRKRFLGALEKLGVERTDALGASFDASVHEATGMVPAQPGQQDQEIIFEERAGYTFNGKLLRASRVVVASRP